ncbi:MAG: cytochrome c biogenesis CcdA family protein, partial [Mycobacteriales bacterium]
MTETTALALSAGALAAVNPCGFAMLPAYLALVVSGEARSRAVRVGRALAAAAAMTVGFVVVFGLFGLVISPLAASVQRHLPVITVFIGVVLLVAGVAMLAGKQLPTPLRAPSGGAPTRRLGSMFGYGVAFAIASLSCTIGPFLAVSVTALRGGDIAEGLW